MASLQSGEMGHDGRGLFGLTMDMEVDFLEFAVDSN